MTDTPAPTASTEPIIARGGKYYRNTRYIMAAIMIGLGIWFGFDGYVNWPKSNEIHEQLERQRLAMKSQQNEVAAEELMEKENQYKRHTPLDIMFQKLLCFVLPPLGILVLIRRCTIRAANIGWKIRRFGCPDIRRSNLQISPRSIGDCGIARGSRSFITAAMAARAPAAGRFCLRSPADR